MRSMGGYIKASARVDDKQARTIIIISWIMRRDLRDIRKPVLLASFQIFKLDNISRKM